MNAPTDLLAPVGWVCTRNDPAEVVFEHEEWPNTVRAAKESEDLWRVEMAEYAGEAENTRTVGYASTRERALDALSTSMSAMNRVSDRTGVVRAMMASTLALHDDAGVRPVTPEWRTADPPFDGQMAAETPRDPWRRAVDARDDDSRASGERDDADAEGGDGGTADGADGDAGTTGADPDGPEAGLSDGGSEVPDDGSDGAE